MTILLTGAAGFIGEHFAALRSYFPKVGELVGVDKNPQPPTSLDTSSYMCVDLTSFKEVRDLFQKVRPATVVHLAGASRVGEKSDVNLDILSNLFRATDVLDQHTHYVLAGSAAEYGELPDKNEPWREEDHLYGVDQYAVSKVDCCNAAKEWEKTSLIQTTWLRFANVYGPGQDPEKLYHFVPSVIDQVFRGKPVRLNSRGLPRRQFVYVDDISRALWLAVVGQKSGVFNLGGVELSMLQAAHVITTAVHDYLLRQGRMPIPVEFDLRPDGGGAMRVAIDSTKAISGLGWTPLVGLYEGMRRTVISRLQKEVISENRPSFIT